MLWRHSFYLTALRLHQLQEGHEKVAEQISRDVSQLCSQLAALWSRFLEAAVLNPHILSYLAQEHHTLRVRERERHTHSVKGIVTQCSDVNTLSVHCALSPGRLRIREQWRRCAQIFLNVAIFIPHKNTKILQNNQNGFITSDILAR